MQTCCTSKIHCAMRWFCLIFAGFLCHFCQNFVDCQKESENKDKENDNPFGKELDISDFSKFNLNDLDSLPKIDGLDWKKLDIKKFQEYWEKAHREDGTIDPSKLIKEFMPGPMDVPNTNFTTYTNLGEISGYLRNMKLFGADETKIDKVWINLATMTAESRLSNQMVHVTGDYEMEGLLGLWPIYSSGGFWMNATKISMIGESQLEKNGTRLEVGSMQSDVDTGNITMDFENLMGDPTWSGIGNVILNHVSKEVFQQAKHRMTRDIEAEVKEKVEEQLKFIPEDFMSPDSISIFDDVLEKAKSYLKKHGLEVAKLPELTDTMRRRFILFTIQARIQIYDGTLAGITSVRRTGDVYVQYENDSVIMEANIGFDNITGSYKWKTQYMKAQDAGWVSVNVKNVSASFQIKQGLRPGDKPQIGHMEIKTIDHIWIDVHGMGPFDIILEIIMNMITNAFRVSISNSMLNPLREAVQIELDKAPAPLVPARVTEEIPEPPSNATMEFEENNEVEPTSFSAIEE